MTRHRPTLQLLCGVSICLAAVGCQSLRELLSPVEPDCSSPATATARPPAKSDSSQTPTTANATARPLPIPLRSVRTEGPTLGEQDQPALTLDQFQSRLGELLGEQRLRSAEQHCRRYPDLTLQSLRQSLLTGVVRTETTFLAQWQDRHCHPHRETPDDWSALLRGYSAGSPAHAPFLAMAARAATALDQGDYAEAIATALPTAGAPAHRLQHVEAWRITGLAHLLSDHPAEAAAALQQAARWAAGGHCNEVAELQLLLSESQRRIGREAEAIAAWRMAVGQGASLLARHDPVCDPGFWERAVYLRPANTDWPPELAGPLSAFNQRQRTADAAPRNSPPSRLESQLWTAIGAARYERGEGQAALVALKKAEVQATLRGEKERLQLAQARCFLLLQQPHAATALLVRLANSVDTPVSHAAGALLGTMKLEAGQTAQGLALLRRSVEQAPSVTWPGRAEAEADLGLAYLLAGDESRGLQWLTAAQHQFQATGDEESQRKSLGNLASYWQRRGRDQQARELLSQVTNLERQ